MKTSAVFAIGLIVALILGSSVTTAQIVIPENPEELLRYGYALLVEVIVRDDATSEGSATFIASPEAIAAMSERFETSEVESCRLVVYGGSRSSGPQFLNPALWREAPDDSGEGCRQEFFYERGTELDSFSLDATDKIRYFELFSEPSARTLFRVGDRTGTVWDHEVFRSLVDNHGLSDVKPVLVVRITYPHRPDGPESNDADFTDGNTLIWMYGATASGQGDVGMEGSASPLSSGGAGGPARGAAEPLGSFPWWVLVGLAAVVPGWMLGAGISRGRSLLGATLWILLSPFEVIFTRASK